MITRRPSIRRVSGRALHHLPDTLPSTVPATQGGGLEVTGQGGGQGWLEGQDRLEGLEGQDWLEAQ